MDQSQVVRVLRGSDCSAYNMALMHSLGLETTTMHHIGVKGEPSILLIMALGRGSYCLRQGGRMRWLDEGGALYISNTLGRCLLIKCKLMVVKVNWCYWLYSRWRQ